MRCSRAESGDVVGFRGVDAGSREPGVTAELRDRPLRARRVVVGDDDVLEEVATRGDRDDRTADAARADDEDPHVTCLRTDTRESLVCTLGGRVRRWLRAGQPGAGQPAVVPPLHRAGVAVVELVAEAVRQVPHPAVHERPTVDDGRRDHPAVARVAELDERAAWAASDGRRRRCPWSWSCRTPCRCRTGPGRTTTHRRRCAMGSGPSTWRFTLGRAGSGRACGGSVAWVGSNIVEAGSRFPSE